jgi:phosphatidate cytidylyltransferase
LKKLITRTITGIVLVVIMLACILAGQYSFLLLFLVILAFGLTEFLKFYKESDIKPNRWLSYLISFLMFGISFFVAKGGIGGKYFLMLFPFFILIMASELYRNKQKPIENIAITIFSIIYLALPLSFINFIVFPDIPSENDYSPKLLIAMFVLIWVYDSGAYLFGVTFGKHRLFERISPKKSWEGAIGGTVTALTAARIISGYVPEINIVHWIAISLLTVISSTFGDLTESMFKRYFQVKDSGQILPGHGGILDRFDSLLFAGPVIFVYLKIIIE